MFVGDHEGNLWRLLNSPAPDEPPAIDIAVKQARAVSLDDDIAAVLASAEQQSRLALEAAAGKVASAVAYKVVYEPEKHPRYPKGHPRAGEWRSVFAPHYGMLSKQKPDGGEWDENAWGSIVSVFDEIVVKGDAKADSVLQSIRQMKQMAIAGNYVPEIMKILDGMYDSANYAVERYHTLQGRIVSGADAAILHQKATSSEGNQFDWLLETRDALNNAIDGAAGKVAAFGKEDNLYQEAVKAGVAKQGATFQQVVDSLNMAITVLGSGKNNPQTAVKPRSALQWLVMYDAPPGDAMLAKLGGLEAFDTAEAQLAGAQVVAYEPPPVVPAGTVIASPPAAPQTAASAAPMGGQPYCKWVTIGGHPVCIDPNSTPDAPQILIDSAAAPELGGKQLTTVVMKKEAGEMLAKYVQGQVNVAGLQELIAAKQQKKGMAAAQEKAGDKTKHWHVMQYSAGVTIGAAEWVIAAIETSEGGSNLPPPMKSAVTEPDEEPAPVAETPAQPLEWTTLSKTVAAGLGLPNESVPKNKPVDQLEFLSGNMTSWTPLAYLAYQGRLQGLQKGLFSTAQTEQSILYYRGDAFASLNAALLEQASAATTGKPYKWKWRDGSLQSLIVSAEKARGMAAAVAVHNGWLAPVVGATAESDVAPPNKGSAKLAAQASAIGKQLLTSNGTNIPQAAQVLEQYGDPLFLNYKKVGAQDPSLVKYAVPPVLSVKGTNLLVPIALSKPIAPPVTTTASLSGLTTPAPAPEPSPPPAPLKVVAPFVQKLAPTKAYGAPPAPFGLGQVTTDEQLGNHLQHLKAAGGTQEAQWYKDDRDGSRWIVKGDNFSDPDRVASELLANVTYARLGLPVPEAKLVTINGKRAYAAKEVAGELLGGKNVAALSGDAGEMTRRTLARGFIADAYLGNWDVVGTGGDNILIDADGFAHRVDAGGSFFYRAMGEQKTDYAQTVGEIYSLSDPKREAAKVFQAAGLDEYTKQVSAMHLGLSLTDDWIDGNVDAAGFSKGMAGKMKQVMRERRDWLVAHYRPVDPTTAETLAASEQAGAQGMGLAFGGAFFKGGTISSNYELSPTGNKELVLYGKLRPKHEDILWGKIQGAVTAKNIVAQKTGDDGGYSDPFAPALIAAAKTINFHKPGGVKGDNQYNVATLKTFQEQTANMLPTSHEGAHHAASVKAIGDAIALIEKQEYGGIMPIAVVKSAPKPPKALKAAVALADDDPNKYLMQEGIVVSDIIKNGAAGAYEKEYDKASGLLKRGTWIKSPLGHSGGVAVKMETPEAELMYFASGQAADMDVGFSRQGYLEVRAKDGTMASARKALARFGIANHDTTVPEAEEAYLSRYAWWNVASDSAQYQKAHALPTVEERLEAKRQYMSKQLGVADVRALPEYDPTPKRDSRGTIFYEAPNHNRPSFSIYHNPTGSGNVGALPQKALTSGVPSMESTESRLRKGLFVKGTSSTSDQASGGAGHLFFYKGKGSNAYFRGAPNLLWRLDTFVQPGDQFGALEAGHGHNTKRLKPSEWSSDAHQIMVAGGLAPEYTEHVGGDGIEDYKKYMKQLGFTTIGSAGKKGGKKIDSLG